MEGMDEDSVMAYLRAGLLEAMQVNSPDSALRQDVLFQVVQEGSQESGQGPKSPLHLVAPDAPAPL